MAKLPINAFLLLSRRPYAVATQNAKVQPLAAAAAAKEPLPSATMVAGAKDEIFWMRDPKTGNWVPETHFVDQQIDVAELRGKLLPKKN